MSNIAHSVGFALNKPTARRIIYFAVKQLHKSKWRAFPSDKDGGFVLCPRDKVLEMFRTALGTNNYSPCMYLFDFAQANYDFRNIAKSIGHLHDSSTLCRMLCSDVGKPGFKLVSKIKATIKTHKDDGEVVPRVLHTAPSHMWSPAMRWISWCLPKALSHCSHIVRDSSHLN